MFDGEISVLSKHFLTTLNKSIARMVRLQPFINPGYNNCRVQINQDFTKIHSLDELKTIIHILDLT